MGDFTRPRPGLTLRERGIPKQLMLGFLQRANLAIDRQFSFDTPGLREVLKKFAVSGFNHAPYVWFDRLQSRLLTWNARYFRDKAFHKLAPGSAVYIGTKLQAGPGQSRE